MERAKHRSLVLGTAQMGMEYGIANMAGRPSQAVADEMVQVAWEGGIREFDTAQSYGTGEAVLGAALAENGCQSDAVVISKLHPDVDCTDSDAVMRALDESLMRLRVGRLYGMLFHREDVVDRWTCECDRVLEKCVSSGKVDHMGVSLYSPDRAADALSIDGLDLLQIRANILDRRFADAGIIRAAVRKGRSVYVRSVFLQGLILMESSELPARMTFAGPVVDRVGALASELGLSRHELALIYQRESLGAGAVIVGAESPDQVQTNICAWRRAGVEGVVSRVEREFADIDEQVLNPESWPK